MMNLKSARQQPLQLLSSDRLTAIVLSFIAGYVDVAGFLKLNGLFVVHLTGNLVVGGAELAGVGSALVWVRLAVIPVFIAAVILTTVFFRKLQPPRSSLLWLEAIALSIFAIVSIRLVPATNLPVAAVTMFVAGSTGVFAMGVQNTLMREIFGSFAPTTIMTGNLTQFTIDLARITFIKDYHLVEDLERQKQEIKQQIRKVGDNLLGFILGTILGAFITSLFNLWSLLLPTSLAIFLATNARQFERTSKVN
jgi:uncharacterized membrane protein YoaK (UPF0700 family)